MASIVTFRDEGGEARGRILTLSDISEVRRVALEKQRFIRTMVARAQEPARVRHGPARGGHDKSLGEELDAYIPLVERADHRIDNLVDLIRDLLTLARSEQAPEGESPSSCGGPHPARDSAVAGSSAARRAASRSRPTSRRICRRPSSGPTTCASC